MKLKNVMKNVTRNFHFFFKLPHLVVNIVFGLIIVALVIDLVIVVNLVLVTIVVEQHSLHKQHFLKSVATASN